MLGVGVETEHKLTVVQASPEIKLEIEGLEDDDGLDDSMMH